MKKITEFADINEYLNTVVSHEEKILSEKLVGVYLFGSLVWGDFDYKSSDIDVVVVTTSDITDREFREFDSLHKALAHTYTHAKEGMIEIVYISQQALQTFRSERSNIAVISPGESFHIKDAGKDWLMNWYMVREHAVTLFGPDPKTIISPITKEEFRQAVKEHAYSWRTWIDNMKQRPAQAYAILTMCRALYTYTNGKQVSKKKAAVWAAKELPTWASLINQALSWREDWRNKQVDSEILFPETKKFVNFIIDQINT